LKSLEKSQEPTAKACPRCGKAIPVKEKFRTRTIMTLHGEISYRRHYHWCDNCRLGFYPLDEDLGLPSKGKTTDSFNRRAMDFAINSDYAEACERFSFHYGLSISTNLLRCIVERLPDPETPQIEIGSQTKRLTIEADGSMIPMRKNWSEAKLAVFIRDDLHIKGDKSLRGMVSECSYIATMQSCSSFEDMIFKVLPSFEVSKQIETVFIADGARWLWDMAKRLYPNAIQILDWAHAVEHGSDVGKIIFGEGSYLCELFTDRIRELLWDGRIDELLLELEACIFQTNGCRHHLDEIKKLKNYYHSNRHRMNYKEHRKNGRSIGSGAIESAHKHVLQKRMKLPGQHWSKNGAEKMAKLRAFYSTFGAKNFYPKLLKMKAA